VVLAGEEAEFVEVASADLFPPPGQPSRMNGTNNTRARAR